MKTIKYWWIWTFIIFSIASYGQFNQFPKPKMDGKDLIKNFASDSMTHLKVIAKYTDEGIKLRWAPTSEEYWRLYNQGGYIVQRFSYDTLGNMDKDLLQMGDTIKPWSYAKFKEYLSQKKDEPYVGAVAQNIYGKTPKEAYQSWTDYSDDLQNRYAFTLLASEYSPIAALSAGLSFVDKDIHKDRFYHYRVIGLAEKRTALDTVDIYLNTFEMEKLLVPVIENPFYDDQMVGFAWNRLVHSQYYSGYFIERSDDGKNFTALNTTPYVNAISNTLPQDETWIKWHDKNVVNYKKYYYRIKGITPFGEISPPSNVLIINGIDKTPPATPKNIVSEHLGGKKVKITWEYDSKVSDLAGFMIGRSRKSNEGFENISGEKPLHIDTRFFIDTACVESSTNFYIVAAVDTANNAAASLVSYAAILDSFPPSKPTGLSGSIDTNGIITLHWPLGNEPDIKGYYIWSANAANHVMINLTPTAIQDTIWRDTISLKTLTKEIYFVIQAVDRMSNSSAFSDTLRLLKPDKVPPVAPILKDYKNEVGKIMLSWQTSTSPDVAYHQVLRKTSDQNEWKVVATSYLNDQPTWTDTNINGKERFQYCVVAVDSSGNVSNKSTPINLKTIRDLHNPITDFKVKFDTILRIATIEWTDVPEGEYEEIIIYRAINKGPVKSLGRVKKQSGSLINVYRDKNLTNKNSYEYTCKVVYDNGVTSNFYTLIEAKLE